MLSNYNILFRSDSESSLSDANQTSPTCSTTKINIIQAIKGIQEVSVSEGGKDIMANEGEGDTCACDVENVVGINSSSVTDCTNSDSAQLKMGD